MILNRILLVDDSPRDTELALEALAAHHLANEVVTLRDGVEALDYLYRRGEFAAREDDDPVVVLLDLKMPRVDGMEVLRQLKSDPAMKSIPVVMIVKPVNFHEFVNAVKQVGSFWAVLNEPPPRERMSGKSKT